MYLLRAKEKADKEAAEERRLEKKKEKKHRAVKRHQRKYEEYVDVWTDAVFNGSYLGSFAVDTKNGDIDKFDVKTNIKEMTQYSGTGQPAQITLSLEGIEVLDKTTDKIKMAHALARIQYMAAHPTEPIIGFVAKNPKVDERYCHCFELKKRKRAQQIHKRLRRALKIFAMENADPDKEAKKKRARKARDGGDTENVNMKESVKYKKESKHEKGSKKHEKQKRSTKHRDEALYDNNYEMQEKVIKKKAKDKAKRKGSQAH
eukprot:m.17329 g.17329  ORF g.17329 m.17329 type:complete len:260 (+) comp11450_c0_seq1:176-955(+)